MLKRDVKNSRKLFNKYSCPGCRLCLNECDQPQGRDVTMNMAFTAGAAIFGIIAATFLFAPQVEAGLVEDLRSGKSDVRAAFDPSSWGASYFLKYMRNAKSEPDFKAFVTWNSWIDYWQGARSAEEAIESMLQHCKTKNRKCRVYAVGHTMVAGYSQKKLADAIEAYNFEILGRKSAAPANPRRVYCKRGDGSAYAGYRSCGGNVEITKWCQRRSKIRPAGRSKSSPPRVMRGGVFPVVPVVHRRDPRCFV